MVSLADNEVGVYTILFNIRAVAAVDSALILNAATTLLCHVPSTRPTSTPHGHVVDVRLRLPSYGDGDFTGSGASGVALPPRSPLSPRAVEVVAKDSESAVC